VEYFTNRMVSMMEKRQIIIMNSDYNCLEKNRACPEQLVSGRLLWQNVSDREEVSP